MTPDPDIVDTSKALFSEGAWYIMGGETWTDRFASFSYPHRSVVYHQCRNHWKKQKNSDIWTPAAQYRIDGSELNIPCNHCGERCPEGLQGLWTLHNFDSIQSDPL